MKTRKTKLVVATAIALCLVFVLAMGGFTFAKYVSSQTVDAQSATVAKWGFVINAQGNLFSKNYKASDAEGAAITVESSDNRMIVAPGTSGSMTFSVHGTAEVRSKLTIKVTDTAEIALKNSDGEIIYRPIVWTLDGTEYTTIEALAAALEGKSAEYAPNTAIDADNATHTIGWTWAFELVEGGEVSAADVIAANNYDTILGQLAVGAVEGYSADLEVKIGFTITVEQIQ